MENSKTSRKALKSLIKESMEEAVDTLKLPKASKKVKKLLDRSARRLAAVYSDILKREHKKKKKAEKFMEDAVKGGKKKSKKGKAVKAEKPALETA
jgi:hypothetical protein